MENQIFNEDCLDTMRRMPDDYLDLILTSPPYDAMRKYGGDKTYHQRLNDTGYSFPFEEIALEMIRVLKPGGVIMWNVADQTIKGSRTGNSMRQSLYLMDNGLKLNKEVASEIKKQNELRQNQLAEFAGQRLESGKTIAETIGDLKSEGLSTEEIRSRLEQAKSLFSNQGLYQSYIKDLDIQNIIDTANKAKD
jgi:DNA modification methylase